MLPFILMLCTQLSSLATLAALIDLVEKQLERLGSIVVNDLNGNH